MSQNDLLALQNQGQIKENTFNPSTDTPVEKTDVNIPLGQTIADAFNEHNPLLNIGGLLNKDRTIKNTNFNPYTDVDPNKIDRRFPDAYIYADNEEEIDRINDQINTEQQRRQRLADSGFTGVVASMAAAVLDPTIAIPVAGWGNLAKGLTAGARAARTGVGATTGAAFGATAVGIQESVLQNAQLTREAKESYINVAFGAAVGGILGGAIGAMSRPIRKGTEEVLKTIDRDTNLAVDLTTGTTRATEARSASAAEVDIDVIKEKEGLAILDYRAMEKVAANLDRSDPLRKQLSRRIKRQEKAFKFISSPVEALRSPVVRGLTSEFATPRLLVNEMFEHTFVVGKNFEGHSLNPIETLLKEDQNELLKLSTGLQKHYLSYTGVKGNVGQISQIKSAIKAKRSEGGILSYDDFQKSILRVVRGGQESQIEAVNKAATDLKKYFAKYAAGLQKRGYLTDLSPEQANKYFPRYYNVAKIIEKRPEFKKVIRKYVQEGTPNPKYAAARQAGKDTKDIDKWIHKPVKDELDADQIADDIIDNIIGLGDESLALSDIVNRTATASTKSLNHRTLLVEDNLIEDFLVNDLNIVTAMYTKKASALTHFQDMLSRNGWDNVTDIKKAMRSELEQLIRKNPDQAEKLTKRFNKDTDLINDMVDIIMGTINKKKHKPSSRALQWLRKYNLLNKLGGVLISSFPDTMMSTFKHGLSNTFKDGWSTYARNFRKAKLAGDELKDLGLATELQENSILKALHDGDASLGTHTSKLERYGDDVVQAFGKISTLSYWNVMGKRIAAQVSGARTMRAVRALSKGKVDKKELIRLRQLGIDDTTAKKINEQFDRFGEEIDGSYISHFQDWDDIEAGKLFARSMIKEADATIVTPGLGDIPAAVQKSEVLRTIFQFKSFAAAATNRLTLTGLQQRNMTALLGFTHLIAMGSLVYLIKSKQAGREAKTDVDTLIMEGMSRSGVLGMFLDYVAALNPYGGSSKYAAFTGNSIALGPSATVAGDIYKNFIVAPSDGELTDAELRRMGRMLPFQNLFYLRLLFDKTKEKK